MAKAKATTTKKTTTKSAPRKPAAAKSDFLDGYAGQGYEGVSSEDLAVPYLRIAQPLTPAIDPDADDYIKGLKAGMFYNTVTKKAYGTEIGVIPLKFVKTWKEWIPNRGGFAGTHQPGTISVDKSDFAHWTRPETGNDIVETWTFYVLVADDIEAGPMVYDLTSSGIKHAKNWNTQILMTRLPNGKQAPYFSSVWTLKAVRNSNDQGTWYQIGGKSTNVDRARFITKPEFEKFVLPGVDAVAAIVDAVNSADVERVAIADNSEDEQAPY